LLMSEEFSITSSEPAQLTRRIREKSLSAIVWLCNSFLNVDHRMGSFYKKKDNTNFDRPPNDFADRRLNSFSFQKHERTLMGRSVP
jgi:hypothetical protein